MNQSRLNQPFVNPVSYKRQSPFIEHFSRSRGYRVWRFSLIQGTRGTFFWDYSGYSCSGLGITEYTEFQFPNMRTLIHSENGILMGVDLRTATSSNRKPGDRRVGFPAKVFPKGRVFCLFRVNRDSIHSVHSAIGSRMDGMIFNSQKNRIPFIPSNPLPE